MQISKFYLQILSTESSFYICDRLLTEINVMASFCARCVKFVDRIMIFLSIFICSIENRTAQQ